MTNNMSNICSLMEELKYKNMEQYIKKSALEAGINQRIEDYKSHKIDDSYHDGLIFALEDLRDDFINTLEVKEVELYNNGWIDCTKQMPPEIKQTSDTLQGHREWTESNRVLVWDSMYGCRVDVTKNGKWMSEQRGGYTGQIVHGIIAWRPIPKFSEELLLKAQKGE